MSTLKFGGILFQWDRSIHILNNHKSLNLTFTEQRLIIQQK